MRVAGCLNRGIRARSSETGRVVWDDEAGLPRFGTLFAPAAIRECPRGIILKTGAFPAGVVAATAVPKAEESTAG